MNIINKINDTTYMLAIGTVQMAVITKEKYSLGWVLRVYKEDDVWYHNGEPKDDRKPIFEAPRAKFEDQLSIFFNLKKYKEG